MKKSFIYIFISSVLLCNLLIRCFAGFSNAFLPFAAASCIPSFYARAPQKSEKPKLACFFISSCAAAYEGTSPSSLKPLETDEATAPTVNEEKKAAEAVPESIKETTIALGGDTLFGIQINNETEYDLSDAYTPFNITRTTEGPLVLIVHTHTSEAYRPTKEHNYTPTDNDRTEDTDFNVARVGRELCDALNTLGISAVHDETLCDYPSYNGSYKKMLSVSEEALKKYPSVQIVIDLHRDAMITSDGTKISTVATVNGEKAAQIMLVVGTDANGLYHPSWQRNFSLAVKLQQAFGEKYPSLARPINVRCERFNGHISPGEILIEVGTNGNTLSEALLSAHAIADVIYSITSDN